MNFSLTIPKVAVFLFFVMFIYSGIMKISGFAKKTKGLSKKTGLPYPINELGMLGVILLEVLGSLIIISYFWDQKDIFGIRLEKKYMQYLLQIYLLFLIVVTFLYHPPTEQLIPFLSNVTTFGGLLLIYNLL
jgi:uncharacterized membrane protein YphA (DoxX/SURF4 family)